jgi:acetoin utilization deacetylase AcuC-like enzyme
MLKVAFHPLFVHPLPENHRFPMEKYDLLPRQLLHEGTLQEEHLFLPNSIDRSLAEKVHAKKYLNDLYDLKLNSREQHVSGFQHSHQLIAREAIIMEGTRNCAELALKSGAAMNIAGGTHHAFTDRGEGFCLMNDQAIAAKWLLDNRLVNKILIIDLDVHQGNGTAEIFLQNEQVFTFSMHGRNNYPLKKESSDLDVELEDGIADKEYLYKLENSIDAILKRFAPDFVFYQCGVDILDTDQLGKLGVSTQGCKQRDEIVFKTIKQLGVPVVCSMGGGYSKDIKRIIEAHSNTFRTIQHILF